MGNEKYGVHTIGGISNTTLWNRFKAAIRGCRLRQGWKLFETSPGVFDYTYWTDEMNIAIADGKYVSIMSAVAPASNNNTPQWIFNNPYSVPFITTDRGTYPYQIDPNFLTRFLSHWDNGIKEMLLSLDPEFLLCWQSAEGTTGDSGTKHGSITNVTVNGGPAPHPNSYYDIPDATWSAHKRANIWPYGYNIQQTELPFMNFMINVSNDFEDIEWLQANIPKAWFKIGFPAHNYNLPAEKWQQEGIKMFVDSAPNDNRMQAEGENFEKLTWFQDAPKQNIKSIFASFAAHGGDIINISLGDMNTLFGTDLSLMTWVNQYLGYRKASETDKGFIILRKNLDFANEEMFDPEIYGPVIDPAQLTAYNNAVASINANTSYSAIRKKIKITDQTIARLNPDRIAAMLAANPGAAYHAVDADQDQDAYNTDCGVDMIQNYEKFVYQSFVDPSEEGVWRFGDVNGYDGRFGKQAPKFYFWTDILSNGNYQTRIEVKYHDVLGVQWSLKYNNGSGVQTAGIITNGTSSDILTAVFVIADMQGGQLMTNDADWIIETTNPDDYVVVEQIDFTRVAENSSTNILPVADAGANQTITSPADSVSLIGTGSTDADGTIVTYLWEKISGPAQGTITNPNTVVSGFTGLVVGEYIIQLTVTDNDGGTDVDTTTIIVQADEPENEPPVSNAGPNQTIQLPTSSATLNGTGSTDDVGIVDQLWTFISGPVTPSITTPSALITNVTGMTTPGNYIFRLYVQDGDGEVDGDGIRIKVLAADNPPVVIIETPNTTVTLPTNSVSVDATVTAGAEPIDTIVWTQISGPNTATINPSSSTLAVEFDGNTAPFRYAFTLSGVPVADDVVNVEFSYNENPIDPPVTHNVSSTVLAGWDLADLIDDLFNQISAINPGNTSLYTDGSGNDGVSTRGFDFASGNAEAVLFSDEADVSIEDMIAGIYVFRITVIDDLGSESFDEITITVNEEPPPPGDPVAVIDPVGTVNMPAALQELNGLNSYDPSGYITAWLWELAPDSPTLGGYTIATPTEPTTVITFTTPGVRKFNLTVTDDDSNTNTASVTFKVNQPPIITLDQYEVNLILPVNYLNVDATVIDIDGTVTLQWALVSGGSYLIDDPTSDNIAITDLEEGAYVFRLYATDDDGAQVYEDLTVYVNIAFNRGLFNKTFRFYLCNDQGVSYIEQEGLIQLQSNTAIRYAPEGWQEIEVRMPRNSKYFGLERNFTSSYKFVKDGAAIIRYLLYNQTQRGIESKLHLVVLKWDTVTGIYEPYFTSEVDLSEVIDDPKTGVTVNLIQGGAVKAIKTNENIVYEIPCDQESVLFDGIDLFDKVNYTITPIEIEIDNFKIPIVQVSNEGDSAGVLFASQSFEQITGFAAARNANTFFKAYLPVTPTFEGEIIFTNRGDITKAIYLEFFDSLTGDFVSLLSNVNVAPGERKVVPFTTIFPLTYDQAVYLHFQQINAGFGTETQPFEFEETTFTAVYTTRVPETTNLAVKPFYLFEKLVEKISDGRYRAESSLLNDKYYLMAIAGDSLRGLENAMIKTSFSDFYESYGFILGGAIGVRQSDQTILFEKKEYFFDNDTEIIDLGEVEGAEFSIAKDFLFNSAKVGYADQDYQQRNGRNEFNSEQIYTFPQSRVVRELNLLCRYRADPYGMEFIRYELFNKTTTDNTGDNDVFIVNVDDGTTQYTQFNGSLETDQEVLTGANVEFETYSGADFTPNVTIDEFTFTGVAQNVQIGINIELAGVDQTTFCYIRRNFSSVKTQVISISGGTGGSTFGIAVLALVPGDIITFRVESFSASFTITDCSFTVTLQSSGTYILKRLTYDSITGIESTATIYNIEELTPKRILLENYFYGGAMYQTPGDLIQFQSGKKNVLLSTTIDDVTITENANVRVEQLQASPIRPIIVEFNTKVPVNILYLVQNAGKGYISFTWNGFQLYGFPMELSVKPAFLDSQRWRILLSSLTDVAGIEHINENVLRLTDMGEITHLNSLKWVPITASVSLQYHLSHMDNELHYNRTQRYSVRKRYYQKQQTNDTTPLQLIVKSVTTRIEVITCKGRVVDTIIPIQIVNPAVQMPYILYQAEIDWSQYTTGVYYVLMTFGVGPTAKQYISEPVMTAEDWPETLLFEYGNSLNILNTILNGGYRGKFRVEGFIQKFTPDSKFTSFEDEPLDVDALYAVPYRKWELFIGGDFGMPDWAIDKMQRILTLDSWQCDGYYYQLEPGAKLEPVEIPGSPFAYWRVAIREQNNRQGIPITGEGLDGGDITVEYNINTKAFTALETPTVDATDNIIQVTDVE